MTSPVWPANVVTCWPVSMSQRTLQSISEMRAERGSQHSPGHVSARCQDLIVIEKSTTAEIARVSGQLAAYTNSSIAIFQTKQDKENKL